MGRQGRNACPEIEWHAGLPGLGHARRPRAASPLTSNMSRRRCGLWRDYFWPHSRSALRQIGLTEKHINARRALCWMQTNRKPEVSLLDIRREALGRRIDAEQTRSLLDGLVRAGWLNLVTRKTGGRDIHRWRVNPLLFSGAPTSERPEGSEREGVA